MVDDVIASVRKELQYVSNTETIQLASNAKHGT